MEPNVRRTPLYDAHVKQKARIVDFAGWAMPVLYGSILEEARSVRQNIGIFDISHMGRIRLEGQGTTALLQKVTSNDVQALAQSKAQYSLLTNAHGGIVDDIIVYREADERYLVVINASNTQKDLDWIAPHAGVGVSITDLTEATAMIAVQGPNAPALVAELTQDPVTLEMERFQFSTGSLAGVPAILCRTGYTGEDGFEVIVPAEQAIAVWEALTAAGAALCGLGARDALRIEAGYPLYGHEIDDSTSPVEAGLMWVVALNKGDFLGVESIRNVKQAGPAQRLVGLLLDDRLQPRQGHSIYAGDEIIGTITSGIFSPTRQHSVAMGYVRSSHAVTGTRVEVGIRDKRISATIVPKKSLLKS